MKDMPTSAPPIPNPQLPLATTQPTPSPTKMTICRLIGTQLASMLRRRVIALLRHLQRSTIYLYADGSSPTFDSVGVSPVVRSRLPGNFHSQADSSFTRSYGDSSAYQSLKEIHPLDWSNKGSESP